MKEKMKNYMELCKDNKAVWITAVTLELVWFLGLGYLCHPTWSIHSPALALFIFVGQIFTVLGAVIAVYCSYDEEYVLLAPQGIVMGICLLWMLIASLTGAKIFRAHDLAAIPQINNTTFEEAIAESEEVSDIALMDTDTAKMFAERALGELSDLVSVYDVDAEHCTTICYQGRPMKVAPLRYDGFFKWANHKEAGIPGYVLIDPVNPSAVYVQSPSPIYYSPSACFSQDLYRHLRNHGLFNVYGSTFFEIDEEGNPYWVTPIYSAKVGLYGGRVVEKVVVMDATTGACTDYAMADVPTWVDIVIDGDTISKYYNWYGTLRNGFWNSVFAQNGCFRTTDDFGYKVIGEDVYIYTGVTSCNNSASATGFVLANSRTGEMAFMSVTGAEEHSAMSAAEGEVSDYGWKASFPSIVNVNGEPVYLMVLKDENNIVKRYAMVNIKSYNIVAIAESQKKVLVRYNALINGEEVVETSVDEVVSIEVPDTAVETSLTVSEIQYIVNGGNTTVYITATNGKVYRSQFEEGYILIHAGDTITVTAVDGDPIGTIYSIGN